MNDIRTPAFAVGYLAALNAAVFGLGAFDLSSAARMLVMGVPLGVLAAVTWSATRWRGPIAVMLSAAMWLSFASVAGSLLVDWAAWEHLGLVALVAPLAGSALFRFRGLDDVRSSEPVALRRAA